MIFLIEGQVRSRIFYILGNTVRNPRIIEPVYYLSFLLHMNKLYAPQAL